ncbi:MAG: phage tail assembly protein, partial [Rikenellaceae bacterium]
NNKQSKFQIEVIDSQNKLKVSKVVVREPLVDDMFEIEKYGGNIEKATAMIALLCTFDGRQLTQEEVRRLPLSDFLDLQNELISRGLMGSAELLSSLSEREGSLLPR